MSLPRLDHATHIADQLNTLAAVVKTRSRASLTDANRILETIAARFFNALFGWELVNLNTERANYPAVDLGERGRRIAIQVTNEDGSDKIQHTRSKAVEHRLGTEFDRLIVFFLLPKKPGLPKNFTQPPDGPTIETWDIADLLKQLQNEFNLNVLVGSAKVLDEEMGRLQPPGIDLKFDISHIIRYAPAELIGREHELKLLNHTWAKVQNQEKGRPRILTLWALGGEGKTSLVAKWAAELAHQDWPGCDAAFAWSFYSQGTREQLASSSDLFLKEALTFFGDDADKQFAASPAGAFEKGQRLARVVGQRRSLLILDGLEPLQYAPTSPTPGQLKDQGIAALLRALAATSQGLCVVTTRYSLPDLKAFWQTTAPEVKLLRLSREAGVHLLKTLGVKGSELRNIECGPTKEKLNEFETLVEKVKGHALTLAILGSYLHEAHAGDIRKHELVKLSEADAVERSGHAFRVMDAYVRWFESDGNRGHRALAVLKFLGLFDRPASADCLQVFRRAPVIPGFSEAVVAMIEAEQNITLNRLEQAKLISVIRDASGTLLLLDTHPLIREYFAERVRTSCRAAWRTANRRMYEHLCTVAKDRNEPTLEDLQPLYQAIAHGCQAGRQQEARKRIYHDRILRGNAYYSSRKLGAMSSNLGAVASFFEQPWCRVSRSLSKVDQAWLLNEAAFYLRALGRSIEAVEPMRNGMEMTMRQGNWVDAAQAAINLAELKGSLGQLHGAIEQARDAVGFADRSKAAPKQCDARSGLGDALHQSGDETAAYGSFREAEMLHVKDQPAFPLLYSLSGFQYCDLLLASAERAAWKLSCNAKLGTQILKQTTACCGDVSHRAGQTLQWMIEHQPSRLDISLNHLTLGCAALYTGIIESSGPHLSTAGSYVSRAVDGLRRAGTQDHLPRGLLTRALLRLVTGARTGHESAQEDLDEAWEIAERGPMKLFLADIHLHRARLFFREKEYPKQWISPQTDLAAAEKLINDCGYHRRDEELADAKCALRIELERRTKTK